MSTTTKKIVKPKVVSLHPKYNEMVVAAITSLKQRTGSSRSAILKYISANYKIGNEEKKINAHLKLCLRNGVTNGLLIQVKGVGASGSFKVANVAKPAKKVVKKTEVKKVVDKTTSTAKIVKKETKKPVVKKVVPTTKSKKVSPKKVKKTVTKKNVKPAAKKTKKP